jgi:hypothetical protein
MKWYYKPASVIIAILCVGPFALPLLWFSPAFNKFYKISISIITILATILFMKYSFDLYSTLSKRLKELEAIYNLQ